ncbi:4-hydroxythreonine-4-phosphate dehydrogenase PdxA [Halomonas daqingensis]|uniref:4-hydroxythreonine-4-phosphate dehydrogenase PdxA n=1 Tax=Billgrantia desiderata TaxID=52021 RepID=A0ABS9B4M8_9GAMM|nr:4-hydroxythreonine-4-phosphate dehydrogenase PdxA [Halomonas desiderata]MCE8042002.1 4-hydroxythreonine-4-phosphate dehydrogenase PdxA [Halomonas desiderata]MCE8046853.1 4-hydroxythreonine-4-phosphate dehydrogenase PdxA [Halomonas desiderata]
MTHARPCIAVPLGDPAGIGPELVAKLLAERQAIDGADVVVVGDPWLWLEGQRVAGTALTLPEIASWEQARGQAGPVLLPLDTIRPEEVEFGRVDAACGASVLKVLAHCLDAAQAERIDAICFAPLNKLAMKQGGLRHEDELHFFAEYLKVPGEVSEFNTLGSLWTSRISSHVPLSEAARYVTPERILNATRLIHDALVAAGVAQPRIAVAAINPHAGEGGTCGREEIDVIAPAVEACVAAGYPAQGPFPADTLFRRARDGEFDAVVTMYHDQGQIALKLLGFERGVTVQGGLPIPITTPAHGTAFDIVGQGKASVEAMRHAFAIACRMGAHHARNRGV